MTARKKNDLRSLIEEARESINEHDCNDTVDTELSRATTFLDQALSLLPDADESASNWQEFEADRPETWPRCNKIYEVTHEINGAPPVVAQDAWRGKGWWHYDGFVTAFRPLPPPYVKP